MVTLQQEETRKAELPCVDYDAIIKESRPKITLRGISESTASTFPPPIPASKFLSHYPILIY